MDKPLSEWTLKKVQELCENQDDCLGCQFYTAENGCMFSGDAANWPLDESETMTVPVATDTNVGHKTAKPRLAEVLGVEVGQKWWVVCPEEGINSVEVWLNEKGRLIGLNGVVGSILLCAAINHPESIIRAPQLTDAELAIMRSTGARWVSKDLTGETVELWEDKPELKHGVFINEAVGGLGALTDRLFPSVRPGDCICVEGRS